MSQPAIVIIDVQNAILEGPTLTHREETQAALHAVIGRIAQLIDWARQQAIPVIFVQHDGPAGHRLAVGTPGWRIRPEIAPHPDEVVVHKTACDSFFETTLGAELARREVTGLIITGCMTQYCVDTTVRRAVSLGYDVELVADGHMTAGADGLSFEQIIAHHNGLLDGFDAGSHRVRVRPLRKILSTDDEIPSK